MAHEKERQPLEEKIDENLRRVYQLTVEEKIPERFEDLLRRLREQDRTG